MKIKVEDLICLALRDSVLTNLSHLYQRVFAEAKERESFLEVFFFKDEHSPLNRGLQKKTNKPKTKQKNNTLTITKYFGGKKRKENFKIFSPIFTWSSPVIFSGLKYY